MVAYLIRVEALLPSTEISGGSSLLHFAVSQHSGGAVLHFVTQLRRRKPPLQISNSSFFFFFFSMETSSSFSYQIALKMNFISPIESKPIKIKSSTPLHNPSNLYIHKRQYITI
ncbi:hypothetical protein ACOSQ2_009806 [Xanthoceras sorbifolium]